MQSHLFKTPKACGWCACLPEGLCYSGRIGAWDGIYARVEYPNFNKVCESIEKSIVRREKAYEKKMQEDYERYLDEQFWLETKCMRNATPEEITAYIRENPTGKK